MNMNCKEKFAIIERQERLNKFIGHNAFTVSASNCTQKSTKQGETFATSECNHF